MNKVVAKPIFHILVGIIITLTTTKILERIRKKKKNSTTTTDEEGFEMEMNKNNKNKTNYHNSIVSLVGNTPMLRIKSLSEATGCDIVGKAEFMSIGGSSKDRVALFIINEAEKDGLIKPYTGSTIFEGTVGSTGISLALIAKAKGYNCHIVMPDDQSEEKYLLLNSLGATVEKVRPCSIVDKNHFVNVAKRRANEMNNEPDKLSDQFESNANFKAHYTTTGPEIFKQTGGNIDAFVMGAGTGGTLAGVSSYLKPLIPSIKIVLADPQGSGLHAKVKHNVLYSPFEKEGSRKRHQVDTIVEGMGQNRRTKNIDKLFENHLIDDSVKVKDIEALEMSRYVMKNDGLFIGSSTSVNLVAAYRCAKALGPGHTIVTILCDNGLRHLTKFWNDEYCKKLGLVSKGNALELLN
ncbi:hypothetical protein HK099_001253 [Clydaea vesicula]|uniref:Tryptophan synthase beta chain-like PALP domain-containing protein n=1 Tax=Clydaea vesicula TaxID=447962 RepID=A0AAD5TYM6_9FUNG|nr:hypothetical protein HK099_001253 [Clydaea vesicula]